MKNSCTRYSFLHREVKGFLSVSGVLDMIFYVFYNQFYSMLHIYNQRTPDLNYYVPSFYEHLNYVTREKLLNKYHKRIFLCQNE